MSYVGLAFVITITLKKEFEFEFITQKHRKHLKCFVILNRIANTETTVKVKRVLTQQQLDIARARVKALEVRRAMKLESDEDKMRVLQSKMNALKPKPKKDNTNLPEADTNLLEEPNAAIAVPTLGTTDLCSGYCIILAIQFNRNLVMSGL